MHKRLTAVVLTLALIAGISPLSLAFEVVPADHWASQAVQSLNAQGVLIGYPDGTFRGDQSATRYELAIALKRLENIVQGLSVSGQGQSSDIAEIKAALAKLGAMDSTSALADRMSEFEKAQARRDQFTNDMSDRVLALENAVADLNQAVKNLESGLAATNEAQKSLAGDVTNLEKAQAETAAELAKILERLAAVEKALGAGPNPELQSRLDRLAEENAALRAESDKQKIDIKRLYWALGLGLAGVLIVK